MITAIWSNDPTFYNVILGSSELVNHIFIKVNYDDIETIAKKFDMKMISENIYIRADDNKYICIKTDKDAQTAIDTMRRIQKTI